MSYKEKIKRTTPSDNDFQNLVRYLDKELAERDSDEHAFYAQYNKSDSIKHVVLYYKDDHAVGCGAFKYYEENTVEIKRMFVLKKFRGKGIAKEILNELESWAAANNFSECILETGKKQPEAIKLYSKCGYEIIPNFGQYEGKENSVCFKKKLKIEY